MTRSTVSPVRVTLVDHSDLAVAGLGAILDPYAARVELVDHRAALAHPERLDVVLYEPIGLTGRGESLLRDLRQRVDAPSAVFSWASPDQLPAATTLPYLGKTLSAALLVVRLEELAAGRYDDAMTDDAPSGVPAVSVPLVRPRAEDPTSVLTPREVDILALIVEGLSNREIGERLTLSVNSVKTYIRTAYRKMGVARRTQAMMWALERGIGRGPGPDPDALVG